MDVLIAGPGAVGSLLAGLMRLSGNEVCLVGRGGRPAAAGLRIRLASGWMTADGLRAAVPRKPDLAMVALGRQHLAQLGKGGLALAAEAGHTVFWNCDPGEPGRLGVAGGSWSLGLTLLTAVKLQEGDVECRDLRPTLVVERRSAAPGLLRDLAGLGMRLHAVEAIGPFHDAFFVARLLELPAAMCGTTIAQLLSYPEGRQIAAGVLAEGIATMEHCNRPLARLPAGDPRELLERLGRHPERFDAARESPDHSWPSMTQAFLRHRPGEARELNRRIVEMASSAGLSLTWNWRLFQRAGRAVSVGFYRGPAELAAAVA